MGSTILLADDSLTIQKVVELTFSDTEHQVVAVSSGEDLLQRLPDDRPDIVICDVLMPGTDGYEVCQRIKSDPRHLHIPVVLLTGTFEPFDRDRALAAGCSEIITKPFEARKLVETVERLLAGDAGAVARTPAPAEVAVGPAPVVPVSPPQDAADYQTRLSPPETSSEPPAAAADDDEALDFTASGFAEMEAAAIEEEPSPTPPEEGIEFEFGEQEAPATHEAPEIGVPADEEPFGDGDDAAEVHPGHAAEPDDEPFSEPPGLTTAPVPAPDEAFDDEAFDDEAFDDRMDAGEAPFDAAEGPDGWDDGAFDDEAFDDEAYGESPGAPPEALDAGPDAVGAPPEDDRPDASEVEPPPAEAHAEPPPAQAASPVFPPPVGSGDLDRPDATAVEPPPDVDSDVDDRTDTAPVIEAPPTRFAGELSDDDVDRIARRVLELASERIEQIAWETVPDMAEIVVRERIRQLEGEVDPDEPAGA